MLTTNSDRPQLGKRVATYYPHSHRIRLQIGLTFTACALGLLAFGYSAFQSNASLQVWSFLVVAAGIIAGIRLWMLQARRVHLFQRGIELEQAKSVQSVSWDEITDVWQSPTKMRATNPGYPTWTIQFQLLNGRKLKLNGFEGAKAIGSRAQVALANRLIGHYQQAFEAGSWVRFGKKLAISDEGITVGLKAFSWYEINEILLDEEDGVRIGICRESTEWVYLSAGAVANFHLLAQLLSWVKSNRSLAIDDAERAASDGRSIGLFETTSECDVSELAASGYEWDEIDDVINGECSVEELLERGPRKRPRVPK